MEGSFQAASRESESRGRRRYSGDRSIALADCSALLFDLDGTLYDPKPVQRTMAAALLAYPVTSLRPLHGLRTIRVLRAYRALHETLRERPPGSGLAAFQFEETARRTGVALADVRAIVDEWMLRRPLPALVRAARPGLHEFLARAQARGLALGVLSDYPVEAKLEALGVRDRLLFAACTTDPGLDAPKPAPDGFRFACERLGAPPERVLYVGDREEVDRAGARAAGLECVLMGAGHGPPSARDFHELGRLLEFERDERTESHV